MNVPNFDGCGIYIWYRSRDLAHSGREKKKQKWFDFASRDPLISRPLPLRLAFFQRSPESSGKRFFLVTGSLELNFQDEAETNMLGASKLRLNAPSWAGDQFAGWTTFIVAFVHVQPSSLSRLTFNSQFCFDKLSGRKCRIFA